MVRREIANSRVIITGASSGIGRELARLFASQNCKIIINARRAERLNELADEITRAGSVAKIVAGDVTDNAVQQAMLDAANSDFGGLDILINNAGVGAIGEFSTATEDRLRRVMEVNFFAPAELSRKAIPVLRSGRKPIIVNISSVLGHRAVPLKSEYCASKFALHGLSDSLRAEIGDTGIDVLLVSPSTTDSEFFDQVLENKTDKEWKLSSAKSPRYVAERTLRAIRKGKHEIILSWSGWWLVWIDRLCPPLANYLVSKFGK